MPDDRMALVDAIEKFFSGWIAAQAMDAALAGTEPPPPLCPQECAIMYGIADSLAQAQGKELLLAHHALTVHLQRFSNGREILAKLIDTANNPAFMPWVQKGGQATYEVVATKKDPLKVFLPLAEQLRLEVEKSATSAQTFAEQDSPALLDQADCLESARPTPPQQPTRLAADQSLPKNQAPPATYTADELNEQIYLQWLSEAGGEALAQATPIVYSVMFDTERESLAFAMQVLRPGHGVMLKPVDDDVFTGWNVLVRARLIPQWEEISNLANKLESIAYPHNGCLSGWHCLGSDEEYFPKTPRSVRRRPSITDLVNSYLASNPNFLHGRTETHPAILAITRPMNDWLIDRYGDVETYWAAMLDAAKLWFNAENAGREFQIFCTLLVAEANVWWNGNDNLQTVLADFSAWQREVKQKQKSDALDLQRAVSHCYKL